MKPTAYDGYINVSNSKVQKGKRRGAEGKGNTENWRQPCSDDWKPDGRNLGHNCPKHHLRGQPGRCAICGSAKHYISQRRHPVKPKMKNAWNDNAEWEESYDWETEEYEASKLLKAKRGRARGQNLKGSRRAKADPGQLLPDLLKIRMPDQRDLSPNLNGAKPEARLCTPVCNDVYKSKPT